jgi:hypothetical protein
MVPRGAVSSFIENLIGQREIRRDTRVTPRVERNLGEMGTPDITVGKWDTGRDVGSAFPLCPEKTLKELIAKLNMTTGTPTIWVKIDGIERKFILDTRSNISLIQADVSRNEIRNAEVTPIEGTGANLCIEGPEEVEFDLHGYHIRHAFYICS